MNLRCTVLLLTMAATAHADKEKEAWHFFADQHARKIVKNLCTNNQKLKLDVITSFQADNAQISNLSGFEYLSNLKLLSLKNNLIDSLTPLSSLKRLKTLFLSHNFITDASILSQLPKLEVLDLSHNKLQASFLCNFKQLKDLNLSHNQIQQLMATESSKLLTTLNLSFNPISQLPENLSLPSLKTLHCNYTSLQSIKPLLQLTSLEVLEIEHCSQLKSIQELFIQTNERIDCRLPFLKSIKISEDFLDETSKTLLNSIRQKGTLSHPIAMNSKTDGKKEHGKQFFRLLQGCCRKKALKKLPLVKFWNGQM